MQWKAEMELNRLLPKKIIQEPNMYIGGNTIIILFDKDIKVSFLPASNTFWDLTNPFWDPFLNFRQVVNLPIPN